MRNDIGCYIGGRRKRGEKKNKKMREDEKEEEDKKGGSRRRRRTNGLAVYYIEKHMWTDNYSRETICSRITIIGKVINFLFDI